MGEDISLMVLLTSFCHISWILNSA